MNGSYVLRIFIRKHIQELLVEVTHRYVPVTELNSAGHWPALSATENEFIGILDCISVSYELDWHHLIPKSLTKEFILKKKIEVVDQQIYRL